MSPSKKMDAWHLEFRNELDSDVHDAFSKWITLVNRLGLLDEDRKAWMDVFKNEINASLSNILDDVDQKYQTLLGKIEALLDEAQRLCAKLNITMPQFGSKDLGLYQEALEMTRYVDEWKTILKRRYDQINSLKERRNQICESLQINPFEIVEDPLPTEEELQSYVAQIEELEAEKKSRLLKFVVLKREITAMAEEIKFVPTLNFEKLVLGGDAECFEVHDRNMDLLCEFHQFMKDQKDQIANELSICREKLDLLWQITEEDRKYCGDFTEKYCGNNLTTLQAFKEEIKRCDDIKKSNIKKYVLKLRDELSEQWDLCGYSQEERDQFEYFNDDLYTEDLLQLHENEIERIKNYRSQNSQLFETLDKLQQLWKKASDLEQRAKAPDRFKNRGGQLLREEKERNAVNRHVPQVEDKLLEHAVEYESRVGKQFTYFGETIQSIIEKNRSKSEQDKKQTFSKPMSRTPARAALTPLAKSNSNRSLRAGPIKKTVSGRRSITKRKVITSKKKEVKKIASAFKAEEGVDYTSFVSKLSSKKPDCRSTLTENSPFFLSLTQNQITPAKVKATTSKKLF